MADMLFRYSNHQTNINACSYAVHVNHQKSYKDRNRCNYIITFYKKLQQFMS